VATGANRDVVWRRRTTREAWEKEGRKQVRETREEDKKRARLL